MFCIECDSDEWDPSWLSEYEEWLLATKCPWPDSKLLLSDKALAYLRSVEPLGDPIEVFEFADEYEPEPVYHNGIAFYDPVPDEVLTLANIQTLTHFLKPKPGWIDWSFCHQLMFWCFWWTTTAWDAVTFLLIGNGVGYIEPKTYPGSRRTSRYLSRRRVACPLLFFPLSWMILSNSVQIPNGRWVPGVGGSQHLPIPSTSNVIQTMYMFAADTYQRVQLVDEMVVLDLGTLLQYNKIKFTVISDGIADLKPPPPPIEDEEAESYLEEAADDDEFFDPFEELHTIEADCQVVIDEDTLQTFMDAEEESDDDTVHPFEFHLLGPERTSVDCVWESGHTHLRRIEKRNERRISEGNGPLHPSAPALTNDEALAFLAFGDPGGTKNNPSSSTLAHLWPSLMINPTSTDHCQYLQVTYVLEEWPMDFELKALVLSHGLFQIWMEQKFVSVVWRTTSQEQKLVC